MSAQYLAREREVAIECVSRACQVTGAVFKRLVGDKKEKEKVTETKGDLSPVTVADYSAQAIVNSIIHSAFPADPIVGEEEAAHLRSQEGSSLRAMVVDLTNSVLSAPLPEPSILDAIDLGKYPGGPRGRHWTLDPIDGTKGFLRGEQYAVCLALIVDGEVHLGVMGCPNLPRSHEDQHSTGSLFVTVKGQGAFQVLRSPFSPFSPFLPLTCASRDPSSSLSTYPLPPTSLLYSLPLSSPPLFSLSIPPPSPP